MVLQLLAPRVRLHERVDLGGHKKEPVNVRGDSFVSVTTWLT